MRIIIIFKIIYFTIIKYIFNQKQKNDDFKIIIKIIDIYIIRISIKKIYNQDLQFLFLKFNFSICFILHILLVS